MPLTSVAMPFAAIEGTQSVSGLDVVRWGQDGLALLTSGGHINFLRGPVVLPELLNNNTSAVLSLSSLQTIAQASGNTLLTITGSNFVQGVAVTWNVATAPQPSMPPTSQWRFPLATSPRLEPPRWSRPTWRAHLECDHDHRQLTHRGTLKFKKWPSQFNGLSKSFWASASAN